MHLIYLEGKYEDGGSSDTSGRQFIMSAIMQLSITR